MQISRSSVVLWLAAAAGAVVAGCGGGGPKLGSVSGTVTLDGKPLPEAEVVFQPEEGSPSFGMTDKDGRYELMYTPDRDGALVGKHTVRITTSRASGPPGQQEITPELVPPEYNEESSQTREVKPGSNEFNFEIPTGG